jgi:hypothetical protein
MIIIAYIKAQYFLRDTEENHKNLSKEKQFLADA